MSEIPEEIILEVEKIIEKEHQDVTPTRRNILFEGKL